VVGEAARSGERATGTASPTISARLSLRTGRHAGSTGPAGARRVGAVDHLLASEEDLRRDRYSRSPLDLRRIFGIKEGRRHDFFPASASRGPWIPLLRHHPRQSARLLHQGLSTTAPTGTPIPRVHDPLEPAWEIELTFADGSTRKQWGNPRLWNLYRGTSVGPYVLQSMLMALEKWLLDFASQYPQQLDGFWWTSCAGATPPPCRSRRQRRDGIPACVRRSASGSPQRRLTTSRLIAAVWRASGKPRHCRNVSRSSVPTTRFTRRSAREADRLPHRGQDLEAAIANLQLGPLARGACHPRPVPRCTAAEIRAGQV